MKAQVLNVSLDMEGKNLPSICTTRKGGKGGIRFLFTLSTHSGGLLRAEMLVIGSSQSLDCTVDNRFYSAHAS